MRWWWGVLVLVAAGVLVPGAAAQPRPLLPQGSPLKLVVLPVKQRGERMPTRAQIDRSFRRVRAWYDRVSYGRVRVTYAIAPPISHADAAIREHGLSTGARRRAAAAGVDTAGALPVVLEPTRERTRSYGSVGSVQIRGRSWRSLPSLTHELGHALGLDHAGAATACRRPFRPLACLVRPQLRHEYGDTLDTMGHGIDGFTGYALAILGFAPLREAPAAGGITPLRPLEARGARVLRLRTATYDWYVDTRRDERDRVMTRRVRAPRGAAIERVRARYALVRGTYPRTDRVPASDPERPCRAATPACLGRQIFQPGRTFTVPGAFRLRVLRGSGPVRVATTWLDRTPPRLTIARARIDRPAGGAPELVLALRAAATGAGVSRVEVDQGGSVTGVDPDGVPGLVAGRRGKGTIRVPLGTAAVARVRLVDAAGNASAPVDVDLAAVPSAPAATITWDPPLSPHTERPTILAAGQVVTVRGRTDPAFAGLVGRFEVIGSAIDQPPLQIGADGSFSMSWTAPESGEYELKVHVPVARAPNGFDLIQQIDGGHLRG